ncbi:hypothetical protein Ancab_031114 [Ancistrocladus abbreviatus]
MKLLTSLKKSELVDCEALDLMHGEGMTDLRKLKSLNPDNIHRKTLVLRFFFQNDQDRNP